VSGRLVASLAAAAAVALGAAISATAEEAFPSAGGTVVTVDGSVVTITVTIDLLLGGLGETELPEGAQDDADAVAASIADYWNQAFQRLGTDCLTFELAVVINAVPMAEHRLLVLGEDRPVASVTRPGHHVVLWMVNNYGNASPPVTYDPYDDDGHAPPGEDYGTPYEHELYADWSPHLETSRDFAHEFGHLLGLGDDYGDGNEPLDGREGTLMDHGDYVDQNLVDRLARLTRAAEPDVPVCETWSGTWDGGFHVPPPCSPPIWEANGTVSFTVAADGAVSGAARITNEPGTCGGTGGPGPTPAGGTFTGRRTDEGFELRVLLPGVGERVVRLVRAGDEATGALSAPLGAGARYEVDLALRCTTCG
jgi:hypothetical protein